jgi:hypothetical protein
LEPDLDADADDDDDLEEWARKASSNGFSSTSGLGGSSSWLKSIKSEDEDDDDDKGEVCMRRTLLEVERGGGD